MLYMEQIKQTNNMISKDHVISQHRDTLEFKGISIFRFESSFAFFKSTCHLELFLANSSSL